MMNFGGYFQSIIAKGEDGEVWVQLLIFIVIGVIAALKNFIGKGKSENPSKRPQEEKRPSQFHRRPAIAGVQNYLNEQQVATEKYAEMLKARRRKEGPKPVTQPQPLPQVLQTPILKPQKAEEGERILDLELDDNQSLRKAVIYHEILGKPISLR